MKRKFFFWWGIIKYESSIVICRLDGLVEVYFIEIHYLLVGVAK